MNRLTLLFSLLITLNAAANNNSDSKCMEAELDYLNLIKEEYKLKKSLFVIIDNTNYENIDINSIELVEIEEDIDLNFNSINYLPEGFNALKGMYDLDWNLIKLVEIEEEIELDFNPKDYLPEGFNALKGMYPDNEVACIY